MFTNKVYEKKLAYTFALVVLISIVAVVADRTVARNYFKRVETPIKAEVGDILFRAYSYTLANSSFYNLSGIPGHVAIVISDGEFVPDSASFSAIKVVEARYYDRTKMRLSKQVGINPASENFGEKYRGRRFLLKTHLTKTQKEKLIEYYSANINMPYNFFASKTETDEFNCVTFARHAILEASGMDIDSNKGNVFFPNDIFKCPLFLDDKNRVHF